MGRAAQYPRRAAELAKQPIRTSAAAAQAITALEPELVTITAGLEGSEPERAVTGELSYFSTPGISLSEKISAPEARAAATASSVFS